VFRSTLLAALIPGAGHAALGMPLAAAALFLAFAGGATAAAWHLAAGLAPFESPLGGFLFPLLLRGLAVLHAFGVVDAYYRASRSSGAAGDRKRLAVAANLLVPGGGYVLMRSWARAATGLALLALVLWFARQGRHAHIDVIYVGFQLLLGASILAPKRDAESAAAAPAPAAARPVPSQPAQVVILATMLVAVIACGYVTLRALPASQLHALRQGDIVTRPGKDGLELDVGKLGVKLLAAGPDWTRVDDSTLFFRARHKAGAQVMFTAQPCYPFERQGRVVRRMRVWLESKGLVYRRTLELPVGGAPATQLRFSGDFPDHRVDHWAIAIPQQGFAFVLMLQCERERCPELEPVLERTRDSLTLSRR
jgi:hypothetical protein